MIDLFDFVWQICEKLVDLGTWAVNFLFEKFTIFGMSVSVWGLLGGVGLTAVIIAKFII